MLVLTRRVGEEIVIGDNIRICLTAIRGERVRIGVIAPERVRIDRAEVRQRRNEFSQSSTTTSSGSRAAACV